MSVTPEVATHEVVVHAQTLASDRALLLELRPVGPSALPAGPAGAHVDLHLGSWVRQYSLVEAGTTDRYLVCVQHEPAGRGGSRQVFERLRVGERLQVSAPRASFSLTDDAPGRTLLVAGGIGITPLLAMAGELHRAGRDFALHAYVRSLATAPLHEYVAGQPWRDRVTWHETAAGGSLRERAPAWLTDVDPGAVELYVCGPPAFLDRVRACADEAGVPGTAVHSERFTPAERPAPGTDAEFTVVAASSGVRLAVPPGSTVAEVLLEHGFDVPLSCEQGICGSCVTGVLAGVPVHRDEVLTPAEQSAHMCVCVSRSLTPELTLAI